MRTKRILKKIAAISTGVAMIGATMTGALALSYSLADYPSPFIQNGVFSGVITVGQNAAASDTIGQSVLLSNLQSLSVSPIKNTIKGGEEEIKLGDAITDNEDYEGIMDYNYISGFQDTSINFVNNDYDIKDILAISDEVVIANALTSSENDYETNVYIEVLNKDTIKYFYEFKDEIQLSDASPENPLKINFLGKQLQITKVGSDGKSFTGYVGAEYFMEVGDSVTVDKKTVKLVRVGSAGAIVVDVDGVQQTISASQTKTINGIEIQIQDTFYESNNGQVVDGKTMKSAANLIVGKDAIQTIKDGDPYLGEDEQDPKWVWDIANLNTKDYTDVSVSGSTIDDGVGPAIGVENDFIWNDYKDNPATVGGCIELPNNYVSICLNGLTVSEDDYSEYTLEYEQSTDLSDVVGFSGLGANEKTIHISNGLANDAFKTLSGHKTKELWLKNSGTITDVFYRNDDRKIVWDKSMSSDGTIAYINYESTKGTDIAIDLGFDGSTRYVSFVSNSNLIEEDVINTTWNSNVLGDTENTNEPSEVRWNNKDIGAKDVDLASKYGVIIRDQKSNGDSDRVVLEIPRDQVKALISINGQGETTISGNVTSGKINPISSNSVALDTEITDIKAQNLILVGGPAVHKLVEPIFGVTVADFTPNEAMVKLADNGANVALLVAGYSAIDSLNACEAVASGKLAGLDKAEAKITSATQTRGSYTIE